MAVSQRIAAGPAFDAFVKAVRRRIERIEESIQNQKKSPVLDETISPHVLVGHLRLQHLVQLGELTEDALHAFNTLLDLIELHYFDVMLNQSEHYPLSQWHVAAKKAFINCIKLPTFLSDVSAVLTAWPSVLTPQHKSQSAITCASLCLHALDLHAQLHRLPLQRHVHAALEPQDFLQEGYNSLEKAFSFSTLSGGASMAPLAPLTTTTELDLVKDAANHLQVASHLLKTNAVRLSALARAVLAAERHIEMTADIHPLRGESGEAEALTEQVQLLRRSFASTRGLYQQRFAEQHYMLYTGEKITLPTLVHLYSEEQMILLETRLSSRIALLQLAHWTQKYSKLVGKHAGDHSSEEEDSQLQAAKQDMLKARAEFLAQGLAPPTQDDPVATELKDAITNLANTTQVLEAKYKVHMNTRLIKLRNQAERWVGPNHYASGALHYGLTPSHPGMTTNPIPAVPSQTA